MSTILLLPLLWVAAAHSGSPKIVRVDFLEALAPRDTTSSEHFRKAYESAIQLGVELSEKRLSMCGYKIEPKLHFYDAGDPIQATEKSALAEKDGAWLIVGPRRSNHYLLVSKGAPETPSVSVMAGATEVDALAPLHLSAYVNNRKLAQGAAKLALKEIRGAKTFFTVVSEDCVSCRDFSTQFDSAAARNGLKKLGEARIAGETPAMEKVVSEVARLKPSVVLVPNYSKVSTLILGEIHKVLPNALFVGGDGWGDGQFGFVEQSAGVSRVRGVTVRGFPPAELGLKTFSFGREALKRNASGVAGGPGMAVLRIMQSLQDTLCEFRPSTKVHFRKAFEKSGGKRFSSFWGVNAFRLEGGHIAFWKEVKL